MSVIQKTPFTGPTVRLGEMNLRLDHLIGIIPHSHPIDQIGSYSIELVYLFPDAKKAQIYSLNYQENRTDWAIHCGLIRNKLMEIFRLKKVGA